MSNIVLARLGENIKASTAGQVATSSGSTTAPALVDNTFSFRNKIINALGLINQRVYTSGTATTQSNQYTLDRWRVVTSGQNLTFSTSQNVVTFTAPAGGIEQVVEGLNVGTGTYVLNWTGTATATVNGTARTKGETFSLTGGSDVTVRFIGGTFSLPQLEEASFPTSFEERPIGTELALCQRYYQRRPSTYITNVYSAFLISYAVPMRTTPQITWGSTFASGYPNSITDQSFTGLSTTNATALLQLNAEL